MTLAERAERNLTAELRCANARIAELESQVTDHRPYPGGTAAVIATVMARQGGAAEGLSCFPSRNIRQGRSARLWRFSGSAKRDGMTTMQDRGFWLARDGDPA